MLKPAVLFAALAATPLLASADMPETRVGPFSFNDEPFPVAMAKVVEGTGVSVVMKDDIQGTLSATGVSGKMNIVVGKMCAYAGAKCDFKDGAIIVTDRSKDAEVAHPAAPAEAAAPLPPSAVAPVAAVAPVSPVVASLAGARDVKSADAPHPAQLPASAPAAPAPAQKVAPEPEHGAVSMAAPKDVAPIPKVIDEKVAAPSVGSAPAADKPRGLEYRTVPLVSFTILNGEGLRAALVRASSKLGVNVSWSLPEDRIASRDMTFTGKRDEVLNDLLTEFRLPGYLVADTNTLYIVKDSSK